MTQVSTALASLLPVAGAVALTVQGVRRMSRARDQTSPAMPPQPKVPSAAAMAPRRQPPPDGVCAGCGTAIPARAARCAICERAQAGQGNSLWSTALHWLVFVLVMSAIMGIGWLITP
jgi:hypothetical protein